MDTKNPLRSKVIWLNLFGLLILLLKMIDDPTISSLIPPTKYGMTFILVSNIIVRFYTTCSIAFGMPVFNAQPPSQAEIDIAIKLHDEEKLHNEEVAKLNTAMTAAHKELDTVPPPTPIKNKILASIAQDQKNHIAIKAATVIAHNALDAIVASDAGDVVPELTESARVDKVDTLKTAVDEIVRSGSHYPPIKS